MLKLFLPFLALALAGCAASSDSGTTATPARQEILIAATGSTTNINEKDGYNLTISGDNNTIIIAQFDDINKITLSGNNNMVTFTGFNDVTIFNATGNDNTVNVKNDGASDVSFTTDTGIGNQLII